ncbi:MAG: twin transmembrane helix small protein [Rhodospirillaceae bacterium]|nr:twin transmembrane helix small protein [Rhodospirillaceae bacterium]
MLISVLNALIGVALLAVFAVLATGLVSFVVGGEFNRKYANKLMRLRVATQAVAVLLLLARVLAGMNQS